MGSEFATVGVRWGPVCVIAAVGLLVSTVLAPPSVSGVGPVGGDKLLHAAGYFAFALVLAFALVPARVSPGTTLLVAFAVPVTFGLGMEVVQLFAVGRTAATGDALANAVGAGVAAVGWYLLGVGRWIRDTRSSASPFS